MSHTTNKGFTLIEILVVVSIIASISSVVLVGIKAAQANGRDSARNSNSLQVRNALALYETEHGGVPSGEGVDGCDPQTVDGVTSYVCKGSTAVEAVLGDALVPQYIPHIPVDVVNTNGLEYSYISGPADPALTEANNNIYTTPTATFAYISELKSLDPVYDPVVVTIPIGVSDIVRYPSTGYPNGSLIISPQDQTLTVSTAGVTDSYGFISRGEGTILSLPEGISCDISCSSTFPSNSLVVLTAEPSKSSSFEGWTGDCSGQETKCTIIMDSTKSVTALFAPVYGEN